MPLCNFQPANGEPDWALWRINETLEDLQKQFHPTALELTEYQQIHHPRKKLEWLSSRLVIKQLVENQGALFNGIYKDAFGKPHLIDLPFSISIAHCFPFAVGILDGAGATGIDIEQPRNKLLRIKDKFLNRQEANFAGTNLELLCKIWTAKEVLYKVYGRKKLIFKKHMQILPDPEQNDLLAGQISFGHTKQAYKIKTHRFEGHFIAFTAGIDSTLNSTNEN